MKSPNIDNTKHRPNVVCGRCGCEEKFDFYVPDRIWESIVPKKYQNRVICLSCFDNFATEKKINFATSLQDLCFAGRKATFRFEVAFAEDD